ncbi:hypothetical protein OE88DRAFT_1666207 [Heliocybe sulcata]|uniref:S-adenosyl-L-methionine-dependent methyltransferase n=1 Tax=Heliocybe sulcata TaxID=5364 RepID=A0A5C3MR77_9AGAM|nr:hypothetical protein OE88DRAFT_1666207 [Heliocybe sulcata]
MTLTQYPTAVLPRIGRNQKYAPQDLADALIYLRKLYNPDVRGSKIKHRKRCYPVYDSNVSPSEQPCEAEPVSEDDLEQLRADAFERSYAVRWLTAFCSCAEALTDGDGVSPEMVESLIQDASALLAICAGTASAGIISRNFTFNQGKIQVQLTDIPLDNHDYSSVGAQTWGGACVLSEMIAQSPQEFGLWGSSLQRPLRILELGAGTGLVSLVVAKLLRALAHEDPVGPCAIIATDYYPSVLGNLEHNIMNNFPPSEPQTTVSISAHFLDWSQFSVSSLQLDAPPFDEPFDLILGADIVYEAEHALWIKRCVEKLLKKPACAASEVPPAFHLVIPLRATHAVESGTIERVFACADSEAAKVSSGEGGHVWDLRITRKDSIVCDGEDNVRFPSDGHEVEYAHYTIGWIKV